MFSCVSVGTLSDVVLNHPCGLHVVFFGLSFANELKYLRIVELFEGFLHIEAKLCEIFAFTPPDADEGFIEIDSDELGHGVE